MSDITNGLIALLELAQSEERMARLDWLQAREQERAVQPGKVEPWDTNVQIMHHQQESALVMKRLAYYRCRDRVDKIRAALRVSEDLLASL